MKTKKLKNKKPSKLSAVFTATDGEERRQTSFFEKRITDAVNTAVDSIATTSDAGPSTTADFQLGNERNEEVTRSAEEEEEERTVDEPTPFDLLSPMPIDLYYASSDGLMKRGDIDSLLFCARTLNSSAAAASPYI